MAKTKYQIGVDGPLTSDWSNGNTMLSSSNTEASWSSMQTFGTFTIEGRKLQFDGNDLVGGTIDKVTFRDAEGLVMATVFGEYSAEKFEEKFGTADFDEFLFAKKDKIVGSGSDDSLCGLKGADTLQGRAGDDWLDGGLGNDRLTGGGGSDSFVFKFDLVANVGDHKPEHDVITDFDAKGGGAEQDYLACWEPTSIKQSGNDTILKFEDGSTLTLLDVKRSDISESDFHLI